MTPMWIVLLVVGIIVVQAAWLVPFLLWITKRSRALHAALVEELTPEGLVRGPERVLFEGARGGTYPRVGGTSLLALTPARLVLCKLTGARIEIPLTMITKTDARGQTVHVRIGDADELIIRVADALAWIAAIASGGSAPAPRR